MIQSTAWQFKPSRRAIAENSNKLKYIAKLLNKSELFFFLFTDFSKTYIYAGYLIAMMVTAYFFSIQYLKVQTNFYSKSEVQSETEYFSANKTKVFSSKLFYDKRDWHFNACFGSQNF